MITVAIAEDHQALIDGIQSYLEYEEDITIVGHVYKDRIDSFKLDLKDPKLDSIGRVNLQTKIDSVQGLLKRDDEDILSKCTDYTKHIDYLKEFGNVDPAIFNEFNDRSCRLYGPAPEKPIDYTKFIIIGNNDPVAAETLFSNEGTRKVLADVFSIKSETDLGTFNIPGHVLLKIQNALLLIQTQEAQVFFALTVKILLVFFVKKANRQSV